MSLKSKIFSQFLPDIDLPPHIIDDLKKFTLEDILTLIHLIQSAKNPNSSPEHSRTQIRRFLSSLQG